MTSLASYPNARYIAMTYDAPPKSNYVISGDKSMITNNDRRANTHHPFEDANGAQYTNINVDFTKLEGDRKNLQYFFAAFDDIERSNRIAYIKFDMDRDDIDMSFCSEEDSVYYNVKNLTFTNGQIIGLRACFVKEENKVWFE